MTFPDTIIEITDGSFDEQVVKSKLPVLLAFCAEGCPASRKLLAMLAEAAPCCPGFLTIVQTSPDESPGLAVRFGIVSAPAVLLFRGGVVCYQFMGELTRRELDELLVRVYTGGLTTGEPANSPSPAKLPLER
jgi:thioredoxin 1